MGSDEDAAKPLTDDKVAELIGQLGLDVEPPEGWEQRVWEGAGFTKLDTDVKLRTALRGLELAGWPAVKLTIFDHPEPGGMPGAEEIMSAWAAERRLSTSSDPIGTGVNTFGHTLKVRVGRSTIEVYCRRSAAR